MNELTPEQKAALKAEANVKLNDQIINELYDEVVEPLLIVQNKGKEVSFEQRHATKLGMRLNRAAFYTMMKCGHDLCHKLDIKGFKE
ncbi:MAG: hypothetical protein WCX64_04810 [Candidatus Micrarchaeia archaeon]|jgi:hypothetical protein